ncbi:MAG: hypothetical protein EXX96DRAFT_550502 [Benjaminiella poitrasii]|nr:MAG: hypothetical protein EXX96DRAFT_550502 [Benjaminiella poitrasii]
MIDEQVQTTINLCLNYLRQSQLQPMMVTDTELDDLEEGELERRQAAVFEWRRNDMLDHSSTDQQAYNRPCDNATTEEDSDNLLEDRLSSSSFSFNKISFSDPPVNTPPSTIYAAHDEDNTSFCTNCKQLLGQLDIQVEKQAYLKRDLSSLASALSEEEDIRSMVEQDKRALEEDVTDITTCLFETLNEILMDEVTNKEGIIQIHRETQGKLTPVLDAWDARETRLKQIKDLLIELDSVISQSTHASCTISHRYSQASSSPVPTLAAPSTVSRLTNRTSTSHPSRILLDQPIHRHDTNMIRIDGFILSEFQQHLKLVYETNNASIPFSPFVKRVLTEDVEPCLFFQQSQGWWKSPWFKKRLLDAISKGQCEIQGWHDASILSSYTTTSSSGISSTSPATSHISTTSSSHQSTFAAPTTPMLPKTKCACCNILRICEFKMRLPIVGSTKLIQQQKQLQPWLPIDRFCRDRLVAICGYYSFMMHLKLLTTTSPLSMFKQVMRHRRKINLARVGCTELFMTEEEEEDKIHRRLSSSSNATSRQSYQQQRRQGKNRESVVLDYCGSSSSDTASVMSVSELQSLEGIAGQIVIVH